MPEPWITLLLLLTGMLAGISNAIAGGGTFFTFPAFLASGIPPVVANAPKRSSCVARPFSGSGGLPPRVGPLLCKHRRLYHRPLRWHCRCASPYIRRQHSVLEAQPVSHSLCYFALCVRWEGGVLAGDTPIWCGPYAPDLGHVACRVLLCSLWRIFRCEARHHFEPVSRTSVDEPHVRRLQVAVDVGTLYLDLVYLPSSRVNKEG